LELFMAQQVIINLAEKLGGDFGVTGKVKTSILDLGKQQRSIPRGRFKKAKIEIVQTNDVAKFDLLTPPSMFDRTKAGFWFGLGIDTLVEIRRLCLSADQIYLCAHGSATDRNQVFYDEGMGMIHVLATVEELADFVTMILDPAHEGTYEVILIICFAARSGNPDERHTKSFLENPGSLRTSLAYKLYKRLIEENVRTRMSARLGEVRVSVSQVGDTGRFGHQVLTQTEDGVIAGLRMAELGREERVLKAQITEEVRIALMNNLRQPANETERKWLAAVRECQQLVSTQRREESDPNTGMLVYFMEGTNLVVNFQGEELYRGAML
jgi:hypothetical protein